MNFGFSILDFGLRGQYIKGTIQVRFFGIQSDNRKSKIQNRKWVGIIALILAFAIGGAVAQAQQPTKIPRIGFLAGVALPALSSRTEAFRQGLRELGYVEGKNIIIEWRSAEGKIDRLPALAAELARLNVDVIVTTGSTPTPSRQGSNFYDTHRHGAR